MYKAFVTRSPETCSGFCVGEAVAEESSHPFQAPLPATKRWLEKLQTLMVAGERQACASTGAPYTSDGLEK